MKNTIEDILSKELKNFPDLLSQLTPYQRIQVIIKLMPYALDKGSKDHWEVNIS